MNFPLLILLAIFSEDSVTPNAASLSTLDDVITALVFQNIRLIYLQSCDITLARGNGHANDS